MTELQFKEIIKRLDWIESNTKKTEQEVSSLYIPLFIILFLLMCILVFGK